ncbi:hypothetical protein H4R24_002239 [Coemansia sp. RSA 988]|nr:hypothetical protein H4R24_002239 [Coemansia sp. RSA 988]
MASSTSRPSTSSGASTPTRDPDHPRNVALHGADIAGQAKRQVWYALRRRKTETLISENSNKPKHELALVSPLRPPALPAWRIVIAMLGGALNASFLIAGGLTIRFGGPGGSLVAYVIAVVVLYMATTSLMEVASRMPDDMPYYMYGRQIFGRAVGAALAWCYWLLWIVILVYEIVASGFIMAFWLPDVDRAMWCVLLLIACIIIVVLDSRLYSVVECTLTLVIICAIVTSIIVGSLIAAGKLGDHKYGLETWKSDGGPFIGGELGVIGASVFANFAVQGAEVGAIMALKSPSRRSRRIVPLAICGAFALLLWSSTFVTGLVLPQSDPWFEKESFDSADGSTFTYIFEKAEIHPAAHVINAILLLSALFDACIALYISTTILQDLATRRLAPKGLQNPTNGRKLSPYSMGVCCMLTLGIWALTFIRVESAVALMAGVIGTSGFITWGAIALMHCVMRWSKKHRHPAENSSTTTLALSTVIYKAPLFPLGPLFCLLHELAITAGIIYIAAWLDFNVYVFLFATMQIFVFIALIAFAALIQHFGYCLC